MRGNSYTVGYMMLITALFVSGVTLIHILTSERVSLNEMLFERRRILMSLDLTQDSNLSPKEVDRLFATRVKQFRIGRTGDIVYASIAPRGDIETYAFPISGPGFWGPIYGYLGVSRDGTSLKGIAFTSHSETPGLGARIDEIKFRSQFKDKDISKHEKGAFIKFLPEGAPLNSKSVHAITGATRTSMFFESFLNRDIRKIKDTLEAGELKPVKGDL